MASTALQRLSTRLGDAKRLIEIHGECTGNQRGRRHGYDALNRSAVILTVAAWEGYCEDLGTLIAVHITRRLRAAHDLPQNVRETMIAHMYEKHGWSKLNADTKTSIWGLTGQGWRQEYVAYARSRIDALNTPNCEKVRKLFSSIGGMPDFTATWGTKRWDADHYRQLLDATLQVRHRIAHGKMDNLTIGKGMARESAVLIERLAGWTDKAVLSHLRRLPARMLVPPRAPRLRS
jgi:hypothetical protein